LKAYFCENFTLFKMQQQVDINENVPAKGFESTQKSDFVKKRVHQGR
jgi:hypothetical protein